MPNRQGQPEGATKETEPSDTEVVVSALPFLAPWLALASAL